MNIFGKIKNLFKKEKKTEDIKKYDEGLSKTRKNFVEKILNINNKYEKINEEYLESLEEILINADIGVATVLKLMNSIRNRIKEEKIEDVNLLKEVIVDEMFITYVNNDIIVNNINTSSKINVILFVGVNGVGKTTTIAKLAHKFILEGKKVKMIAGDTFRAGAYLQLKEWATRTNSSFYGVEGQIDPSSVIYDGLKEAEQDGTQIVLIDTAGRLQNKDNLMKELDKINKTIKKVLPDVEEETLLVIDANTGQNGINQAKEFKKVTNITGVVLTKLDSTAKGGIVLAIKEEVGIPVKYIGFGEKDTDLEVFDLDKYIYGLFKGLI
jgi:signal recognition particle-docking protein ftsY